MLNHNKLTSIICAYKEYFSTHWEDEKYRWEAIQHFQNHWNIYAGDFLAMFMEATDKTLNLLDNINNYPRGMIKSFSHVNPEAVRGMFVRLFDESRNLSARITQFMETSETLRMTYGDGTWKLHYQTPNAITTYLWLRYPDKYFIYKYSEIRTLAKAIDSEFVPKKGNAIYNVEGSQKFYNEIRAVILQDAELDKMIKERIENTCYPDLEKITMTLDIGFFVSRFYEQKTKEPYVASYPTDDNKQEETEVNEPYTKADFLSQVYMTEEKYDILTALLHRKKNLILQGAPGVGKTFAAKRLAYSLMGEKDDTRVAFIQFHQSYSYEDFILGYKPQKEGFQLTEGIFYRFCENAQKHPNQDYFFIIDEINRGNMSKIFGELLMLIEKDYRGMETVLAYGEMPFSVPENLYLIGMMNTADRSLAMIDYALRRRFGFFEMEPGFHSDGFMAYQDSLRNETFNALIERIIDLNKEIQADETLGEGFCIGHSYFCGQEICTEEWMKSVVRYDIIPMLQEYWFDDKQKVQQWENNLNGVFHD